MLLIIINYYIFIYKPTLTKYDTLDNPRRGIVGYTLALI